MITLISKTNLISRKLTFRILFKFFLPVIFFVGNYVALLDLTSFVQFAILILYKLKKMVDKRKTERILARKACLG